MNDIRSDYINRYAIGIAMKTDEAIMAGLIRRLGTSQFNIESLRGRLCSVTVQGEPGRTISLDDVPFMWIGDTSHDVDGTMMTASFPVKYFG